MTRRLSRLRRWCRPAHTHAEPAARAASSDPTRPRAVVRDGVPIIHEGPPGFPGRFETDEDER